MGLICPKCGKAASKSSRHLTFTDYFHKEKSMSLPGFGPCVTTSVCTVLHVDHLKKKGDNK